jgi:hypothetical protein
VFYGAGSRLPGIVLTSLFHFDARAKPLNPGFMSSVALIFQESVYGRKRYTDCVAR